MNANNCSESWPQASPRTNNSSLSTSSNEVEQDCNSNFPDGGWRAWGVVLGSWCAMVPSFGLMNTIGVFEAWLADHQLKDYSKASIGWIFSLYVFFLYFGSIQVGRNSRMNILNLFSWKLTFSRTYFWRAWAKAFTDSWVCRTCRIIDGLQCGRRCVYSTKSSLIRQVYGIFFSKKAKIRILPIHAGVQCSWRYFIVYGFHT